MFRLTLMMTFIWQSNSIKNGNIVDNEILFMPRSAMERGVRSRTNYKDIDLSTSIHTDTEHMAHLATRRVDGVDDNNYSNIQGPPILSTIFISQSNACCGWPMDRLKTEFDPVKVNAIGNRLTHYQKVNMVDEYWI